MSNVFNNKNIVISVVIKTLNEEKNISECLGQIFDALEGISFEVILVDSLSVDKTVDIAKNFEIKIIQIQSTKDRLCGVGGQVGFVYAQGDYLLMLDGDMRIQRDFVKCALNILSATPKLAAVGGFLKEKSESIEYLQRMSRKSSMSKSGSVSHLTGGGLYRMSALQDIQYFTNINLHSFEEFEVGLRLRENGWNIERLPMYWVEHYGHNDSPLKLLSRRFYSGNIMGAGELIRASFFQPYFFDVIRVNLHLIITIIWWFLVVGLLLYQKNLLFLIVLFCPLLMLTFKKRCVISGCYSLVTWNAQAFGMIMGLFRPQKNPVGCVPVNIVK